MYFMNFPGRGTVKHIMYSTANAATLTEQKLKALRVSYKQITMTSKINSCDSSAHDVYVFITD